MAQRGLKIQPFAQTREEYAVLVDLHRMLEPEEQPTVEWLREQDRELAARNRVVRVIGSLENKVIASGTYWHSSQNSEALFQFDMLVNPDHQRGCVPAQMHDFLLCRIEGSRPAAVVGEAKEDETYRTRLLEASNFKLEMRFPRSQLDVTGFDFSPYVSLGAQLQASGIELITLADAMKRDENWQQNV